MNRKLLVVGIAAIILVGLNGTLVQPISGKEPLRVHPSNPRYFTGGNGKAIYLTGSHTWSNLQDRGNCNPPPPFDYTEYLDFMQRNNHNFMRMWVWENALTVNGKAKYYNAPLPYKRVGPGLDFDGKPKFNLNQFNQAYFDRLRQRVIAAGDRSIYVSVMLFQGWSIDKREKGRNPWIGHPFNRDNNINGINGDPDGDGEGKEAHSLRIPSVVSLQEAFVRKVVDTISNLDNVLYEVSNESPARPENTKWQYHIINYIRRNEAVRLKQHPVLMTWQWPPGRNNDSLFESPAEAISPGWGGNWGSTGDEYRRNPPAADGRKVILSDTDHLWGLGGDHGWVWKSFIRGLNPIFMDPFTVEKYQNHPSKPKWKLIRKNMGYTLTYSRRVNLASMVPRNDLSSTTYCLSNPGKEYLIYLPSKEPHGFREKAMVDLSASSGTFVVEWFNPITGEIVAGGTTISGSSSNFTAPFLGDAVLYIYKQ
jgi:hypothetical protein